MKQPDYCTVVMALLVVVQVVEADGWKRSAQDVSCTSTSPALLYSGRCPPLTPFADCRPDGSLLNFDQTPHFKGTLGLSTFEIWQKYQIE